MLCQDLQNLLELALTWKLSFIDIKVNLRFLALLTRSQTKAGVKRGNPVCLLSQARGKDPNRFFGFFTICDQELGINHIKIEGKVFGRQGLAIPVERQDFLDTTCCIL